MGEFEANRFSPRSRAEQDSDPTTPPSPLINLFRRMREFQERCATELNNRRRVRKKTPEEHTVASLLQEEKRRKIFKPAAQERADARDLGN